MTSSVAPDYWHCYNRLPPAIQARARKQYALWQENHWHPSLHYKRVGPFWSVRVDDTHRAVAALIVDQQAPPSPAMRQLFERSLF